MRRALLAALLAALSAASLSAASLFVLELEGGSRVFALDRPVQKGRVVVFHRHPDGIYTSIAADEVVKIATASSADRTEKFQPGETMLLGGEVESAPMEGIAPPPEPPATRPAYYPPDYGYGTYWDYGWSTAPPPHRPPPPPRPMPTNIGPNGFPILARPGQPGSTVQPIGSNGFPIIAPPQREPR